MSSISTDDIRWNDEARAKILEDSDRVLREAVTDVAATHADGSWEDAFAELNARLKDRFIDFEPGPDLRKYAEAIVGGEIEGVGSGSGSDTSASSSTAGDAASSDDPASSGDTASSDDAVAAGDSASNDSPSLGGHSAAEVAADAGLTEAATPQTDGSGDASVDPASGGAVETDGQEPSSSDSAGSDDPASGGASDGTEAPNETIDDPNDPTITDAEDA